MSAAVDPSEGHLVRSSIARLGSPRFQTLRVLGEGGSGIVYEARWRTKSDTEAYGDGSVALKVLRAELAPSERERQRFLDEAERMQRVAHDGIVRLIEAGFLPDGRPYLAMPLLDGETLAARIERGKVPASTAIEWFCTLARSVEVLHSAGIVHRDIKPENVILVGGDDDASKRPLLLDFGIARDMRDESPTTTTVEGRVRGTPAYMAPERFFGAAANVASDVYELGVLLYAMLVGRLPWGSEKNVDERLNPTSPRDAGADVSPALSRVLLRALSTRTEMRPPSVEAFARAIEESRATSNDDAERCTAAVAVLAPPVREAPLVHDTHNTDAGVQSPTQTWTRAVMFGVGAALAMSLGWVAWVAASGPRDLAPGALSGTSSAPSAQAPTASSTAETGDPSTAPATVDGSVSSRAEERPRTRAIGSISVESAPPHAPTTPRVRLPASIASSSAPRTAPPATPAASSLAAERYFEDRR